MTTMEQADRQMRALVPVLEREIAELEPVVEASRGGWLHEGFAHELGIRQRGLAAIRSSLEVA